MGLRAERNGLRWAGTGGFARKSNGENMMEAPATLEELIAAHPFFRGLAPELQSVLGDCASLRRFGSHQQIFQEGSEADHFYLIISGKVILEVSTPPCGSVVIQTLGPGDALGWSWLFPPHQWCFTAITAAPTDVISFGAQLLRQKIVEDRDFANEMLTRISRTVVERLQATRDELVHLHRAISERRVAA